MLKAMRRGRSALTDSEQGAALVEFALLFPVFMMLILGMFSGGIAYNQKLELTHATREGARYGATVDEKQTFSPIPPIMTDRTWAEGVRDLVVERSAGVLTPAQVTCVALVTGPRNSPTVVPPNPAGNSHVWMSGGGPCPYKEDSFDTTNPGKRVQVSVQRPGEIRALFFTYGVQLKARANSQYEGK